ncbi:MAG TPA: hypothetical protein VFQ92_07150 [Blastocatellia bacterium]|nr:hypothetical protein [Blastocatellia bacterium]
MLKRIIWLSVLLLLTGCALRAGEAPPEDVDKAAALFFERLKSAEYEVIYADASEQFKEQVDKATIIDNLKQITALGRIQDYRRLRMIFEGEGKNRVASPVYSVIFDQNVTEITVNFKDEGGEWKLVGFSVKQRGGGGPVQPS